MSSMSLTKQTSLSPASREGKPVGEEFEDKQSTVATVSDEAGSPCASVSTAAGGLSPCAINERVQTLEYAVRGKVLDRAMEIGENLSDYPFEKLLPCHIGNPHAVGMPATTYIREILSLVMAPFLDDEALVSKFYAEDSVERAKRYRSHMGDPGAYTHSQGAAGLRKEIAGWLAERDGAAPPIDNIFMCNGASDGIECILQCLLGSQEDAVLVPVPQYPLYTATITKIGGTPAFYYLDEKNGWSLDPAEVEEAYKSAIGEGLRLKGMVVISPGNPASTSLTRAEKALLLRYCQEKGLCLLADEVYQDNVYDDTEEGFTSFRRVLLEEGLKTQLVSFHSSSKGLVGECGFRGGLFVLDNVEKAARDLVYKLRSITLCPNVAGQVVMTAVCTPPKEGSPSYEKYREERAAIFKDLKYKATLVTSFFNTLPGVSCQRVRAGMYVFPRFEFSEQAVKVAESKGISINMLYCLELLEATGIVTVPGDGFGEFPGTYHLRMTILPELDQLKTALEKFRIFHHQFWARYCQ